MRKHRSVFWQAVALCFVLLGAPVRAQTPPDFTDIPDILQGQRYFLRDDDLLALSRQRQAPPGPQQDILTT